MGIVNEFKSMQCTHVQQCVYVQREVFSCCGEDYIRIMEGSINYSGTNYTGSGLHVIRRVLNERGRITRTQQTNQRIPAAVGI